MRREVVRVSCSWRWVVRVDSVVSVGFAGVGANGEEELVVAVAAGVGWGWWVEDEGR